MGSAGTPTSIGLTPEFLAKSLNSKILSYNVTPGSAAGDNFTSVVTSIRVQFQKKSEKEVRKLDLMLKSYPTHPARRSLLDDTHMFRKELLVYRDFIPELIKFGRNQVADFDKELKLAIVPFYDGNATEPDADSKDSPENQNPDFDLTRNFILMEDVRSWGFKMADKAKGLDYDQCKLVFTELAKLHALNWAYATKHKLKSLQDRFPFLKDEVFCDQQKPLLTAIVGQNYQMVKELMLEEFGPDSEVVLGFLRLEANVVDTMLMFTREEADDGKIVEFFRIKPRTTSGKTHAWRCGSHGDMWVNNMLFCYGPDGKPEATIFVDLQLYREATPMLDLAYFTYTSTTSALRRQHLNDLLRVYADTFTAKCALLRVDPFPDFSFGELQRRFHVAKLFGLISAIFVLPIILVKPEEATDLDTVGIESTKLDEVFKELGKVNRGGDQLKIRMAEMIRELYEEGLI